MKKITLSTFKSFVKKNREALKIKVESAFDGMIDGTEFFKDAKFQAIQNSENTYTNNLGLQGVWLVGNSRDYFNNFENETHYGIEVSNSCRNFIIAIEKKI